MPHDELTTINELLMAILSRVPDKRELFAAMAPAKEIRDMTPDTIGTCAVFIGIDPEDYDGEMHYPLVLAKVRCAWADALLAELAKELPR